MTCLSKPLFRGGVSQYLRILALIIIKMIYIKIPICPKKSDYSIDNVQVQKTRRINEDIRNKERTYDKNNANIAYVLSYVIVCVIIGCIIRGYKPNINEAGLFLISCIIGLFAMLPIGCFIGYLLQRIGKELEPSRILKNDENYNRSNEYIKAKNKHDNEIKKIKTKFPKIEECDFNLQKYNAYWIDFFEQQIHIMIRNKRRDTLRKITICGDKYFSNLDLIGCKNVHKIDYNLYSAERMQSAVLITYIKKMEKSELDEFIVKLQNKNGIKGIIITEENWHKESWFISLIKSNNIELIHIYSFEDVVLKEINKANFTILPYQNSTPFNVIDIPFTDIGGYKLYGSGRNYIGFLLQLVTEVFISKKEIFDKIKTTPKSQGTYGIIRYSKQYSQSIYGLVFFRNSGEIHYFMPYFCAAIDNETKKIANIVTGNQRMRYDCGDYWYQNWSDYCWED